MKVVWVRKTGVGIMNNEHRISDLSCLFKTQDSRLKTQDSGLRTQDSRLRTQNFNNLNFVDSLRPRSLVVKISESYSLD